MAYQALYRKWRPSTFDEVVGQEAVTETLKNQVRTGKVGHAYLFCGTRGCGKTSVAKILARAVNCPHAEQLGGNPCNRCAECESILSGSSMNVFEIDAASNNGVDNIREIREQVEYPPVDGRYKVYIIDEVHMLSAGAFNALLKTLEEPPAYVIFILATTDPQKVPPTILSRCQRYDFRRMKKETIIAQIRKLSEAEGFQADDRACAVLAEAADGSMRDALSLLDQCLAYAKGAPLTDDKVLEILGTADTRVFSALYEAMAGRDAAQVLRLLDSQIDSGKEPGLILNDFLWYLRNLLVYRSAGEDGSLLEVTEDSMERIRKDSELLPVPQLIELITDTAELAGRVRSGAQKRVLTEVGLIRLTGSGGSALPVRPAPAPSVKQAVVSAPEPKAPAADAVRPAPSVPEAAAKPQAAGPSSVSEEACRAPAQAAASQVPAEERPTPIGEKLAVIREHWEELIRELSPSNRALFAGVVLTEGKGGITVIFKNHINFMLASKNAENGLIRLSEAARSKLGVNVVFLARQAKRGEFPETEEKITDEELKKINFPVEVES